MGLCMSSWSKPRELQQNSLQKSAKGSEKISDELLKQSSLPEGLSFFLPESGPLSNKSYRQRLEATPGVQVVSLPLSGVTLRYAWVSQRGYYPDQPNKPNQDAVGVHPDLGGDVEAVYLAVYDGHGLDGSDCAQFAKRKVYENLVADNAVFKEPEATLHRAIITANKQLHSSTVDDSLSGTTAVGILLRGSTLYITNVGDSRAVLAEQQGDKLVAVDLTHDQTPFRKDECERVKACGARVLTLEQLDGLRDPSIQEWGNEEEDNGDPPRLWHPQGTYPGTAFTRSIGDSVAEQIGVCGDPETTKQQLTSQNPFLVIATDGVWEFLSSQMVIDMVAKFTDPMEAAVAITVESYQAWLATEARTDDISIIIIQFAGLPAPAPISSPSLKDVRPPSRNKPGRLMSEKSMRKGLARGSMAMVSPPSNLGSSGGISEQLSGMEFASTLAASNAFSEVGAVKSTSEVSYILNVLQQHPLFSHLDVDLQMSLIASMARRVTDKNEVLIEKGTTGTHFYVVEEGEFALIVAHAADPDEVVRTYSRGGDVEDSTFGETALVSGAKPYGGSIHCRADGVLWALDKRAYKLIVMTGSTGNSLRSTQET